MIAMSARLLADDAPDTPSPEASVLVARAAGGDQEAWAALAALYGKRLYALARSRLRDDHLAEDVAQSVFVTLAEKLKGPEGEGYREQGRFESWLFRIAMNRVRDIARKKQRRGEVLTDAPGDYTPGPSEASDADTDDLDALRTAIARLSTADREVVELRHHAGLSFKQIAESLDVPMGTVLARHHRALRKLKTMIESHQQRAQERDEVNP